MCGACACLVNLCTCCATCGTCCAKICPSGKTRSRLPYLFIIFLGTIVALVMRYWGQPIVDLQVTKVELCEYSKCVGYGAVYRISFVMCILFLMIYLALWFKNSLGTHTSLWGVKILYIVVMLILSFVFIPNDLFDVYANIARFVSAVFLLLQIIILIDFAYSWHESWIPEEEKPDQRDYRIPYIIACLLMWGASITLFVFSLDWFRAGSSTCARNTFFIAFTLAFTVSFTLLSITNFVNKGLLTPSVVSLYCFLLLYSSLSSDPSDCNSLRTGNDAAQIIIGIAIAAVSITYAGWSISNSKSIFQVDDAEAQHLEQLEDDKLAQEKQAAADSSSVRSSASGGDVNLDQAERGGQKQEESADDAKLRDTTRKFHFVMAACAMYLAMLLTNWGSVTDSSKVAYDMDEISMWIKIASQWATALMFTWTLVAPLVCRNREFD